VFWAWGRLSFIRFGIESGLKRRFPVMRISPLCRIPKSLATVVLLAMMGGCASSQQRGSTGASPSAADAAQASAQRPMHAECLVCKKNADMACIDVEVDAKTPTADYNGKRYYFCSEECKTEFLKHPARFAAVK
jgi:YHS domain-containing protein